MTRGCAADSPGEQRLGVVHQARVGRERSSGPFAATAGVRVERLPGALRPRKRPRAPTVVHRGNALPRQKRDPGATAGCLNRFNEYCGVPCSTALGLLISDMPRSNPMFDEHAPEQAVSDVVQSLESEQLLRLRKSVPNNPWTEKVNGSQPTWRRGQEQRIDPDAEPPPPSRRSRRARTAFPEIPR